MIKTKFSVGQIIKHKLLNYRGVIIDVDPKFSLSDSYYKLVEESAPPKNSPWYHILVDNIPMTTYVAERNLEDSSDESEIKNPLLENFFANYKDGHYDIGQLNS